MSEATRTRGTLGFTISGRVSVLGLKPGGSKYMVKTFLPSMKEMRSHPELSSIVEINSSTAF